MRQALLRHPALHFIVLGSLLWLGAQVHADWQARVVNAPSAERIQALVQIWQQGTGKRPDKAERAALIQQEIDQRILFSEALRRGLHLRDPVVLQRLHQDITFLGIEVAPEQRIATALALKLHESDELIRRRLLQRMHAHGSAAIPKPSEDVLRRYHAENAQLWPAPARLSFEHVLLADAEATAAQAEQLATALNQGALTGDAAYTLGDPFLLGHAQHEAPIEKVRQIFGPGFAQALRELPVDGAVWQGPLRSPYGLHLVRLSEHHAGASRPYDEVRSIVLREWRDSQERAARQDQIERLRKRYRVRP